MLKNYQQNRGFWLRSTIIIIIFALLALSASLVWAITLPIPDFNTYFKELDQKATTKIYDRTGQVMLYSIHPAVKRSMVPLNKIAKTAQQAVIAIEDENFYHHNGISITGMARAFLVDISNGSPTQGASTITQQVVKNVLLTSDKTIARKVKEVILALKLEKEMSKDQILELYLNEVPYGGNMYGIEEASQNFFRKDAKDLSLPQSAYLAAMLQAPTTYSPYGNHVNKLEERKNLVLDKMAQQGYITAAQAAAAKQTKVAFEPAQYSGLKAPHFVFFIKDYLEQKYGADEVENGGLKVITTLDWDLQSKAEDLVKKYGSVNMAKYKASNAGLVAIDPKNGQILSMVGSVNYYNTANDGNFNVTLAHRQPGSAFKPFVYATAMNQGYTPSTVLFDVPTEFNPSCASGGTPGKKPAGCYMPRDYDGSYQGPLTLKSALAQSRNVPAVKLLYLVGVNNAIDTAKKMGITSLKDQKTYGLTLVLGGGEVSLLEMTDAYSVFADDGTRNPYTGILEVDDASGHVLEKFTDNSQSVLPPNTAREISSMLDDNAARQPTFAANTALNIPERQVAVKTGTTNDSKDAWVIGYTPYLAAGIWVGNNNNSSMDENVAGYVMAPLWRDFMRYAFTKYPNESFPQPDPIDQNLKPVLRGVWQGNQLYTIDKTTGQLVTDATLPENRVTQVTNDVHNILYWVDKSSPTGSIPSNPSDDPQFKNWEYGVRIWAANHGYLHGGASVISTGASAVRAPANAPVFTIVSPAPSTTYKQDDNLTIKLDVGSLKYPPAKADFYINGTYLGSTSNAPYQYNFVPQSVSGIKDANEIDVTMTDSAGNKSEAKLPFLVEPAS